MLYKEQGTNTEQVSLSILIPCLNEEENIEKILNEVDMMITKYPLSKIEVIVLDDSSTDRTLEKAVGKSNSNNNYRIRVIQRMEPRRGYGAIVRFGIAAANGVFCIPVSADNVDPIEIIPIMLNKMQEGADLVACSRYLDPNNSTTIPFTYKFFQSIWRVLVRIGLGKNIPDSTYSFKMFRRIDALALGITSNGFSISPEIYFKVFLSGGKIETLSHGQGIREAGKSKFSFVREGFGYSFVLIRACLHRVGILWF